MRILKVYLGKKCNLICIAHIHAVQYGTFITGLWIKNGTRIFYSLELQVGFWCQMRFERFPFDHQVALKKIT